MAIENADSHLSLEQREYILNGGEKIPQPRPLQLFFQEEVLPSNITSWHYLHNAHNEGKIYFYDFGQPSMLRDHDSKCLEEYKPSKERKDSQSRFLINENGEIDMPRRALYREDFGPGEAGQRAFDALMFGKGCERKVDDGTKKRCGNEPVEVLDFDVAADLEQLLICGVECRISAMEAIQNDLSKIGRSTVFGINGRGRA